MLFTWDTGLTNMGCIQCKIRWSPLRRRGLHRMYRSFKLLRLTELLRKIHVQPVDRASAIAQITVQGTEVVLGTTTAAEFPKSEGTPLVTGSVGALISD